MSIFKKDPEGAVDRKVVLAWTEVIVANVRLMSASLLIDDTSRFLMCVDPAIYDDAIALEELQSLISTWIVREANATQSEVKFEHATFGDANEPPRGN